MLYGDQQQIFNRLKWHWGIPDLAGLDNCTECRLCEEKCNQKLPILDRYAEMKRMKTPKTG
jgi:CO dehydrogenase/acetyl-CoA synthase alpha subunit